MQIYEKELSDTDSIYCAKPTNSHQSSIFIGPSDGPAPCGLFGANYASDKDVVIELSRDNLMLNVLSHYLGGVKYTKRGTSENWDFNKNWLLEKQIGICKVFAGPTAKFHVSVNKETTRTYLKGIAGVKAEGGTEKFDIRNYLFSGDKLRMGRMEDGTVVIVVADRGGENQLLQAKTDATQKQAIDFLTITLECFRAGRDKVKAPAGWNTFDEWAKAARVAFDGVDETKATDPNFDYAKFMRQFAISETVANTQFLGHTSDEKAAVLKFLHEQQTNPQIVTWYLDGTHRPQANGEDVKGMGVTATLYFMMELHPNLYASWSDMTYDSLSKVGLHNGPIPSKLTLQSYDDCKAKQCQVLAKMKEMGIGKAADDPSDADYITVNEFLWFVKTHHNEIENKIVEKKMEPAKHKELPDSEKNKKPAVNMADSDDVLLLRLRAALRTKPFAILAGHSGTGKSRMVRKLAYMTCNDEALRKDANGAEFKEPGNFCMIQVKPNWHDSCDLLGYYSELGKRYRASEFVKFICKAYAYPKTPFFVCLDEMNLAPVEQYFAEYLSAIESRKLQNVEILEGNPLAAKKVVGVTTDELVPKTAYVIKDETGEAFHADWVGCETPEAEYWLKKYGLTIPRNLFVVGTVNMDESTNQFSRKVLDRAMTIEMTDADFDAFGKQPPELNFANVPYMGDAAVADLLAGKVQATELLDDQKKNLNALKAVLASTSFAVAYRFANEYALYEDALKSTSAKSYKPASVEGADPTDQIDLSALTSKAEAGSAASADGGDGSGATAEGSAAVSASAKKPAIPSAFDDMVLMKVLPRISGDEADVKRIFYEGPAPEKLSPRPSEAAPAENTLLKLLGPKKDTASVRKIKWILARGGSYLSFWP